MKKNQESAALDKKQYNFELLCSLSFQNNPKLAHNIKRFKKIMNQDDFEFLNKYDNLHFQEVKIELDYSEELMLKNIQMQYDIDFLESEIYAIFQNNSNKSFFEKYNFSDKDAQDLIEFEKNFKENKNEKVDLTKTTRIILNKIKI
ncbi:hypothetical protein C4M97_02395 [Mycoplasmopsis pullorum]|uniref:hypothetical protein n=4 Tax=Mycoplasmopsis pullorum TaxID=48003 RepID=UPI00111A4151|nr:hypothetical protein [Mycoplasmopsis pullorum]TNK86677.1 hypothetical protein C4M82_02555 [Mycoplasmopsis pullorum]TNK88442.1 hypothetical protein C4M89_02345 [Mycoplasmopsis pullorum]TNK89041.1 hypothetical protein C4M97_02395 [Mycoplasmopsis pullorum]TNK92767.1 hypothetical protein C4M83_02215 [Mycoplasmopsis pullorum]TNK98455.1 hypothetical protein C4M95_01670 [Mycoplasmopsis pullorum]